MTVPAFVALGLVLALALNREGRTGATLRAVFFGASVLSVTIVTIIWKIMYLPEIGLISNILGLFGIAPIPSSTSTSLVLLAIATTTVWWIIGLPMMLFLAALQQIPANSTRPPRSTMQGAGEPCGRSRCPRSGAPWWSS